MGEASRRHGAKREQVAVERAATMRDYKNRIAAMLQKAMRETALNKLKALQAAHADATNSKMFDGPAMLDAMRRDANAKLTAEDDETERGWRCLSLSSGRPVRLLAAAPPASW